jgi:Xaa-Pro aminopeptidase
MDLYVEVQAAITRAAGEPIVMMGDFAAGERSGRVGGPPTDNVLQPGDLMIFDLFPRIGGYRADIANTLCAGQPTQEQRDHLAVLQAALQAGEATLRPGVTAAEVYAAGREPIAAAGLGDAFPHHAGHGLGLGHPEPPFLVPESQEILQAGDVVTLEPGAYRRGWGGARIEHNYLITETGYQRLSNHQIGL